MKILAKGRVDLVNPTDLFASQRMKVILDTLKSRFDLVILDTPPVMAVPDARVLSKLVDKVIFTVAWDDTPRKVALSALHQLQREGDNNIAGIVLQKVNIKQYGKYGNSGYYYHYSQYGQYYSG
jgi:Mrp family chromosome partitioning ATPase